MTAEERHIWYDFLRQLPFSVKRQKVIGPYIVDFYCPKASLVIEIDGGQHYTAEGIQKDRIRDEYMASRGFQVLRFTNLDIRYRFHSVCKDIWNHLPLMKDK